MEKFRKLNCKALTITIMVMLWMIMFPWIRVLQIITLWMIIASFILLIAWAVYSFLAELFDEIKKDKEREIEDELWIKYLEEMHEKYEHQGKEINN